MKALPKLSIALMRSDTASTWLLGDAPSATANVALRIGMSSPVTKLLDASQSAGQFIRSLRLPAVSTLVASPQMPSTAYDCRLSSDESYVSVTVHAMSP